MNDPDFKIRFHHMTIRDLDEQKFVVAKLRRVSSSPVHLGTVCKPTESAVGRLADIFRLGINSRNYADLCRIERLLRERFHTDPESEWRACNEVICRSLGVERLDAIAPKKPMWSSRCSGFSVTFHTAKMLDLPYVVASVNGIFGSPAPLFLTWPSEKESAIERLRDVFRVGLRGRAFRDFLEVGRECGKGEDEIVAEWKACERAAWWALERVVRH